MLVILSCSEAEAEAEAEELDAWNDPNPAPLLLCECEIKRRLEEAAPPKPLFAPDDAPAAPPGTLRTTTEVFFGTS